MFRQGFTCPALLVVRLVPRPCFLIRGYHPLWPAFPDRFDKSAAKEHRLLRFRSPLLSESRLMSVPPATEMFQFTGFALHAYVFSMQYPCGWVSLPAGTKMFQFPASFTLSSYSEILGLMPACGSPRLIAACHIVTGKQIGRAHV